MSTRKIGILSGALELKVFTVSELAANSGEAEALVLEVISEYNSFFNKTSESGGPKWRLAPNYEPAVHAELTRLLPRHLQDSVNVNVTLGVKVEYLLLAASSALSRATLHQKNSNTHEAMFDELAAVWRDLRAIDSAAASAKTYSIKVHQKWLRNSFRSAVAACDLARTHIVDTNSAALGPSPNEWEKLSVSLFRKLNLRNRILEFAQTPKLFLENELVRKGSNNEFSPTVSKKLFTASFISRWQERLVYVAHALFDGAGGPPKLVVNIMYAAASAPRLSRVLCFTKDYNNYSKISIGPSYLRFCKQYADGLFRAGEEKDDVLAFSLALSGYNSLFELSNRFEYRELAASAKNQIGNTQLRIGVQKRDHTMLQEAAGTFTEALTMIRRERAGGTWAEAMNNLGSAQLALGSVQEDRGLLESAIDTFDKALQISQNEQSSIVFVLLINKGNALIKLSEFGGNNSDDSAHYIQQAQSLLKQAVQRAKTPNTVEWAIVHASVGTALLSYYSKQDDPVEFDNGISAFQKAYHYFSTEAKTESKYAVARENMSELLKDKNELLQRGLYF